MKRSEMVELLNKYLTEYYNVGPIDIHEPEVILNLIEAAGMAPPETREPCETYVLYNGNHVKTEDSFIITHKWDEE